MKKTEAIASGNCCIHAVHGTSKEIAYEYPSYEQQSLREQQRQTRREAEGRSSRQKGIHREESALHEAPSHPQP